MSEKNVETPQLRSLRLTREHLKRSIAEREKNPHRDAEFDLSTAREKARVKNVEEGIRDLAPEFLNQILRDEAAAEQAAGQTTPAPQAQLE